MKLTDIIALAKAGYKKSDIEELLDVPVDEQETSEISDSRDDGITSEGDVNELPEETEIKPDYEKLYMELMDDYNNLKNDLKIAQEHNIRHDNSLDETDVMKELEDVFRSYM